ncbi:hypothetical protein NH340_JMT04765 [Sarcoptes scabiei]|nr:hypothetical protein NH340_JMT04765 [Sarcoptes scabiei]
MLTSEVLKCSFSNWYKLLGDCSIESDIIRIDKKFIEYLLSDGIILPESCNSEQIHHNSIANDCCYDEEQFVSEVLENQTESRDECGDDLQVIEFPSIEKQLRRCLRKFQHVFIKLNWSSCEDSCWMHATRTKCSDLTSIFLLLKSSDKIVHDLTDPFEGCEDSDRINREVFNYELIVRKWIEINPSMEFRCFIVNQTIVAISQRDVRTYYEHIAKEQSIIVQDIFEFFNNRIRAKFPLHNYVIDVFRPDINSIVLIDVNVFGPLTDSLLFDWEELIAISNRNDLDNLSSLPEFRFIENHCGIQPQRFEYNSLPLDVLNGNISNVFDDSNLI